MGLPKIVPCRCGCHPELIEYNYVDVKGYYRRWYYVYCPKCGMEAPRKPNRTQAIKIWNCEMESKENAPAPAGTGDERKEK